MYNVIETSKCVPIYIFSTVVPDLPVQEKTCNRTNNKGTLFRSLHGNILILRNWELGLPRTKVFRFLSQIYRMQVFTKLHKQERVSSSPKMYFNMIVKDRQCFTSVRFDGHFVQRNETCRLHAKLELVLLNPVKFGQNPTSSLTCESRSMLF